MKLKKIILWTLTLCLLTLHLNAIQTQDEETPPWFQVTIPMQFLDEEGHPMEEKITLSYPKDVEFFHVQNATVAKDSEGFSYQFCLVTPAEAELTDVNSQMDLTISAMESSNRWKVARLSYPEGYLCLVSDAGVFHLKIVKSLPGYYFISTLTRDSLYADPETKDPRALEKMERDQLKAETFLNSFNIVEQKEIL